MGRELLAGREVRQHMGAGELVFHSVMIICTVGLWYPVYRHRKNRKSRTTDIYRLP
jgi:hypothetical protein